MRRSLPSSASLLGRSDLPSFFAACVTLAWIRSCCRTTVAASTRVADGFMTRLSRSSALEGRSAMADRRPQAPSVMVRKTARGTA